MKKKIWIILAVIVLLGAVIASILVDRYREKHVNTYDFPETIVAVNHTDNHRADTIAMLISHMILGYDTIHIEIFNIKSNLSNDEIEIVGFIQTAGKPHSYQVFLKKTNKNYVMEFLSHELVHMDQIEKGDLETFIGNYEYNIYQGDTIRFREVPYQKRPFEIDALKRQRGVEIRLKNLLFKK